MGHLFYEKQTDVMNRSRPSQTRNGRITYSKTITASTWMCKKQQDLSVTELRHTMDDWWERRRNGWHLRSGGKQDTFKQAMKMMDDISQAGLPLKTILISTTFSSDGSYGSELFDILTAFLICNLLWIFLMLYIQPDSHYVFHVRFVEDIEDELLSSISRVFSAFTTATSFWGCCLRSIVIIIRISTTAGNGCVTIVSCCVFKWFCMQSYYQYVEDTVVCHYVSFF